MKTTSVGYEDIEDYSFRLVIYLELYIYIYSIYFTFCSERGVDTDGGIYSAKGNYSKK